MSETGAAKQNTLFATPLLAHVWSDAPALNAALIPAIMAAAANDAGEAKSNVGGWHSQAGLLEFCGASGRTLVRHMYDLADEATRRQLAEHGHKPRAMRWTLSAWVNVNQPGDFNQMHTHPGSTWSGTYYVDPGDPPADAHQGTALQFLDPCQGRANTFLHPQVPNTYTIRPEPGLMVLFPSYVPHMVHAHRGTRPRISIAFNLRREPYP